MSSQKTSDMLTINDSDSETQTHTQLSSIKQEFAFAASDTSLNCIASENHLLAVAGNEEVIKLFNLRRKMSAGELSSSDVHSSTITALTVSKQCTHLLSGDEKGVIGIWRIKD